MPGYEKRLSNKEEFIVRNYVIKGNICYSKTSNEMCIVENGYVVCEDGKCAGVFEEIPDEYKDFELRDFKDNLIIPGMVDLHIHSRPAICFSGYGYGLWAYRMA